MIYPMVPFPVTHTTAFLTRRLPVDGRTEYQLLLMKASDRGRKVKLLGNCAGVCAN